ncbi:MAG: hemolysin family protein [Prevotella sp.]|nr:hemolysin family protein [Bacteroides sp.]MCM1366010.1 hemolysin family protein [Prevotella sp.]MCM1436920.1 hemolysin family protein [Prevotella sp.]
MDPVTAITITIIAILFSGLFSGTEIAYVQSSKVRMQIDASKGGMVNKIINGFSRHEEMFISTLLVGNNIVLVIYGITFSILINPLLQRWFPSEALVLIANTLLSTGLILITGEFLPKTTFRINPHFMMRFCAIPIFLIYIILYPISILVSFISKGLMALFGIKNNSSTSSLLTIEQLDDYLSQSIDETPADKPVENELKIFRNAIDFKDTQIGECMIPRNEIVAVNIDSTSREELIKTFIATGLSKIIVYHEDIDQPLGYIHISELFNPDSDWQKQIRPLLYTPETKLANKMMRKMMAEKRSLAIVVDEFGGTAGLVTLEDLVEEIFGDIEDEHDQKKSLARRLPDGTFEFSGRAEIEKINEEFDLDIRESEEYHTIAGYILENLEALPQQGDTFIISNLKFTVLQMSQTRIELVAVSIVNDDE